MRTTQTLRRGFIGSLACLVLLLILAVPTVAPVAAASNGQWSIFPARAKGVFGSGRSIFNYTIVPGETVTDAATIANYTSKPLTFELYSSDAYDVTDGGGFALRARGYHNVDVGSWVRLPSELRRPLTVPARTAATFPFEVTVPAGTVPGDHAGGIVALNVVPKRRVSQGVHLTYRFGVGVRIYVDVVGHQKPHPGLAISGISSGDSQPLFDWATGSSSAAPVVQVSNTGDTILSSVTVTAYATDMFGNVVHRFPAQPIEALLPGQRVDLAEGGWKSLPMVGPVTLHVTASAGSLVVSASSGFWMTPWLLLVIVLVVLAALFVLARSLWRRRRSGAPATP